MNRTRLVRVLALTAFLGLSSHPWAPGFPRVDELLEKGTAESNLDRRKAHHAEARQLIWDAAPWIFVAEGTRVQVLPIAAMNLRGISK